MSSLTRQQQIIVAAMGAATVLVLAVLSCIVLTSMSSLSRTEDKGVQVPGSPTLAAADLATALFPTWTPEPTSTPYVAPTAAPRPLAEDAAPVLEQVETDVIATRFLLPQTTVPRWPVSISAARS